MNEPTEHPGDLLSAYLDGELPPDGEADVDAHLDGCGACRAELDALDAARRSLRSLPAVPAPAGLVTGIVRARQRASRRGVALALVAASLAVVVGLAATPAPGGDGPDRPRLALTSEGRRFDAATTIDRSPPPGGTVSGLQRPRAEGDADAHDGDASLLDRLGDRVGDAVSGLLHAVGG